MFWIRGYTTASLEFTKIFSHRPQLRDDNGEWSRIDFLKSLFLFFFIFIIIQEIKIVFVRFDLLYFNLKNNREELQSQSHHSAKLKN